MEQKLETQPSGILPVPDKEARLNRSRLVNAINYLHSQGRTLFAIFRHTKYDTRMSVEAAPVPCKEDYLFLSWKTPEKLQGRFHLYKIQEILFQTGRGVFSFEPQIVAIDDKGVSIDLGTVTGKRVGHRKMLRHRCDGVDVEIIQNGLSYRGRLDDFSALSFSATVSCEKSLPFSYINNDLPLIILLRKGWELLYSGECRIVRHNGEAKERTYVFEPVAQHLSRFKQKMHRSPRHRLHPSPNLFFVHPLTGKSLSLEIDELSGSGFSVIESYESATLIPGMILPKVEIEFAFSVKVTCRVQVLTRGLVTDNSSSDPFQRFMRYGVAILDMSSEDQTLVASVLHQATNRNSFVCTRIDLDELWRFFFKSGFIYSKKYLSMQGNLDKVKENYRKLYLDNPDIARHFVYRENGEVQGHISMVRFFEKTWLFHHHASTGAAKAGIVVLDQIGRYVNDFYHMRSSHFAYVLCYFRPDNRFPRRVFGGFQKELADLNGCSLDDFAHLSFRRNERVFPLSRGLTLEPFTQSDLYELTDYYHYVSGGLLLKAFELEPASRKTMAIRKVYENIGMKRDQRLFSLKDGDSLKAVFIANMSDLGLNMSNLTNCITAIVLDDTLSGDDFTSAFSEVIKCYEEEEVTALVYPVAYAEKIGLSRGKVYTLWSFNTQYTDVYLDFVHRLTKKHQGDEK